ncbi:MAG: hypothetical protein Q7S55_05280 [Nanoarchaeota archaeon]|nr:hypothetical protein [Nanoarchaeota archaeon]
MISIMDLQKLNQTDIATITRFVDRIRRNKSRYNQEQQALLDLANKSLTEIIEVCKDLNGPAKKDTIITKPFNDRRLRKVKEVLLAITDKISDLKDSAYTVLAILGKID